MPVMTVTQYAKHRECSKAYISKIKGQGTLDGALVKRKKYKFDLTEGNHNGKNFPINDLIQEEKVIPFISGKNEYLLFKRFLREIILPSGRLIPKTKSSGYASMRMHTASSIQFLFRLC